MKVTDTRENILAKIREALKTNFEPALPALGNAPVEYKTSNESLCHQFAAEFRALQGEVVFCSNKVELIQELTLLASKKGWTKVSCPSASLLDHLQLDGLPFIERELSDPQAGITDCEYLVARTGTIVMSTKRTAGRILSVYAPVHIVIAYKQQLEPDLKNVFSALQERFQGQWPSALFFASGPSRTGDIEKTLVLGVHGPVEVYVFLLDDEFHK